MRQDNVRLCSPSTDESSPLLRGMAVITYRWLQTLETYDEEDLVPVMQKVMDYLELCGVVTVLGREEKQK